MLQGGTRLRQALGYRRFRGPIRVLILDTGYLVVRDVLDAAEDLGWQVATLAATGHGRAGEGFVADLLTGLATHQPDFVLTINHLGFDEDGVLAQLLSQLEIFTASWFVDHPLPVLGGSPGNVTPHCVVFCFERTALPWLASQGYTEPVYLPTASNHRYYHPSMVDRCRAATLAWPLTFAGNSWWTKARQEPPPWAIEAAATLGPIDRHLVRGGLAELLRQLDLPGPRAAFVVAEVALAEASSRTRGRFARTLQPLGLRVHGDPHWQELAPGLDLHPFVDYERGLPALFAASQINANITAEQMPTAVNQRVWDVPAVGGFLLTDAQEDVLELFREDQEVVVYRSLEEARDKARHYLRRDGTRRAIATRAFARVDRCHRFTHRLECIAAQMRARHGLGRSRGREPAMAATRMEVRQ